MPFIQQMLQALQQMMQREIQAQVDRVLARGRPIGQATPFHSLLNPTLNMRDQQSRVGRARSPEPVLHEEEPDNGWAPEAKRLPQKGDSWQALFSAESASAAAVAAARPMYLAWSEQRSAQGGWTDGRTPTASPLVPTTEPRRRSPLIPPTEPQPGNVGVPPHLMRAPEHRADGGLGGTVAPATAFGGTVTPIGPVSMESAEKSVMVCRHWKSKGWCKMEEKCKFLHPDHKRGSGVVQQKGSGAGNSGATNAPEEGASGVPRESGVAATANGGAESAGAGGGGAGSRLSRRAGRGRRSGGGAAPTHTAAGLGGGASGATVVAVAPGLVSAGTSSSTAVGGCGAASHDGGA